MQKKSVFLGMFYGYIRVSSDKQTVENQRFEIERFCKENNVKWLQNFMSPAVPSGGIAKLI